MTQDSTGAVTPTAPATTERPARISRPPAWQNRRLGLAVRGVFLLSAITIGTWGAVHTPWYQERRISRMSLTNLQRERGNRMDDPLLLYYTGLRLNQQGRYAEADPILRQAVGLDPESSRLRDEWARALLGSGLTTAAFGELRQFAGTHPDSAPAHLLLGKFYFTQRSMQRAAEELERSLALDASNGEAWAYLAGARDALGDPEKARDAAEKATALRPNNAGDHLVLASLRERANQSDAARHEYSEAARLAPAQAAPHREYARWLLRTGKPEDRALAEAEARKAIGLDGADGQAFLILGRALAQSGQTQAALDPLTRAATLNPDEPSPARELTQAYQALGQNAQAATWQTAYQERQQYATERQQLGEALRVNPRSVELHTRLARLLGLHGDVDGCIHNHASALHGALDSPPVLIAAANDLTDGGHAKDAFPLARRAASITTSNPAAHETLGNVLLGMGQPHDAAVEYNKALGWWPQRKNLYKDKLQKYFADQAAHPTPAEQAWREAQQLENQQFGPRRITPQVEELAQRAVSLEPTNPKYLWMLLRVQVAQRKNEAAIQTANQMLAALPNEPRAHAMLGVLLADKARTPEEFSAAEQHLQAATADKSLAPTWHYGRGLLALRRQQGAEAVKELKQALALDPNTDVTYYKLSEAQKMAGDTAGAAQTLAAFQQRTALKRKESDLLGDIAQHPKQPELYTRAAQWYDSRGENMKADAIRAEARRRFGKTASEDTH